jgi:archaellum biogenesis ATPase FlaH
MQDISELVIKNIAMNEEYCRSVLPFLKKEYFEGDAQFVFTLLAKFVAKYNTMPNCTTMEYEFSQLEVHPENAAGIQSFIQRAFSPAKDDATMDMSWLVEKTERWCQDRALFMAIMESIEIINGNNDQMLPSAIPDMMTSALGVGFDRNIGHDYTESAEDRYEYYHTPENRIPFDLEMLNKVTAGGVKRKTLNVFLGGTGSGKSMALCHLAASYLSSGLNCLYITMEMSEEKIAERIDANLMDVKIQDIPSLTHGEFQGKIAKIKKGSAGRLIIKEYPTAAAHAGHFRALLSELKLKKNFIPDVILIDYINICASSRIKSLGGTVGSYGFIKAIAEELRGLAIETDTVMWSATQTNREGMNSSDVDITNTSESFGLPATADLMLALIVTEELEELDQIMVKQLKNRYNDVSYYRRFILGMERAKMRLYDAEESAQEDVLTGDNSFQAPSDETDYSAFKM